MPSILDKARKTVSGGLTCFHMAAKVPRALPEDARLQLPARIRMEQRSKGAVAVREAAPVRGDRMRGRESCISPYLGDACLISPYLGDSTRQGWDTLRVVS